MRVTELAKELKISDDAVLKKLKVLKLKAKGDEQELNNVVAAVVRGELKKDLLDPMKHRAWARKPEDDRPKAPIVKPPVAEKTPAEEDSGKKPAAAKAKKVTKKVSEEKLKEEKPEKKPTAKKKTVKKPVEEIPPPKAVPEVVVETKPPVVVKVEVPKVTAVKIEVPPPVVKAKAAEEPFVPLKPLVKKKRRMPGRGEGFSPDIREGSEGAVTAVPSSLLSSTEAPEAVVLQELELDIPISVKDFALRVQQKTSVVLKKLMQMRVFCNINSNLGEDVVKKLAQEFGFNVTKVKTQEQHLVEVHKQEEGDPKLLKPRAPVVTLMGHVDHGKTSLLDRIRKSQIVDTEHGGITQHIGAYSVVTARGRITFLDTPGHEAFTAMRARGAHITDLVILVVAADEGMMPQTLEAIDHARAAEVPIVVALNKIDRRNADVDRVKKQLADHELKSEDWGGSTIVVGVSATTGEGVDKLLEMVLLEAEMLELRANSEKAASGIVVEAHMSRGKGAIASLIVQSGTLKLNDIVVVGPYFAKVKALFDDRDRPIAEAGPSMPVEILGLPEVPEAGELFYVVQDDKKAKEITSQRQETLKQARLGASQRITLEDLYSRIQEGAIKELNVIIKADVQGSAEALKDSLEKIPSEEVKVKFIHVGVGDINASDVILAVASNAIIIGFHVDLSVKATEELEKFPVDVRQYRIIYDAVNDVRKALEGMLTPKTKRKDLARVEIRQVFKLSKSGIIAGCYVLKGKVTRKAKVDVVRDGKVIHSSEISSLKRFKDDVREVNEGYECGMSVVGFDAIQPGDQFVTFEIESIARTL